MDEVVQRIILPTDLSWCWPWSASVTVHGYGVLYAAGLTFPSVHREVYKLLVEPIPDKYVIDHVCHNLDLSCPGDRLCLHRRCMNPDHLEPVTQRENILRARVPRLPVSCPQGHPYDLENTYVRITPEGGIHRLCHACRIERGAARRKRAGAKPRTFTRDKICTTKDCNRPQTYVDLCRPCYNAKRYWESKEAAN